jgi:hypothetical protein
VNRPKGVQAGAHRRFGAESFHKLTGSFPCPRDKFVSEKILAQRGASDPEQIERKCGVTIREIPVGRPFQAPDLGRAAHGPHLISGVDCLLNAQGIQVLSNGHG